MLNKFKKCIINFHGQPKYSTLLQMIEKKYLDQFDNSDWFFLVNKNAIKSLFVYFLVFGMECSWMDFMSVPISTIKQYGGHKKIFLLTSLKFDNGFIRFEFQNLTNSIVTC